MEQPVYYLDHAAATPIDARVIEAMLPFMSDEFYNPSSPYAPAVAVRKQYEAAKARLAATFGAKTDDIIITAGATESINLAFRSVSGHVVTSAIEHDAVLAAAKLHETTIVQPTEKGIISPESIRLAITDDTELVSIQLANNEIGTIQPIRQIAQVVTQIKAERAMLGSKTPLYLHCDASQGFGQIDVHVGRLGIDMLTLNSGKMYGPKQMGLLWVRAGVAIEPFIVGGGQERGLRSGTENVAGVIGFALAAERASSKHKAEAARLGDLRDEMQRTITVEIADAVVSGYQNKRLPGSLHISIAGLDAERLVFRLESKGVLLATGSACAANKGTRSHVLTAIGLTDEQADGSLRITLGRLSNEENCRTATEIIIGEIEREKKRIGLGA